MPLPPAPESLWLWAGLAAYAVGALVAWCRRTPDPRAERRVLVATAAGVALLGVAIAERWLRTGHGPFLSLFEVLLSNLFSLGLVVAVAYWRVPAVRPGARHALTVLVFLGAWTLSESPQTRPLPATYDNPWLWVHVTAGKLFLGAALVALGIALSQIRASADERPAVARAEVTAWRWMSIAFVFHSLMLVAGAAWAQDAWGRMWSWDPLETWSFITWLVLGGALHARITYRVPPRLGFYAIAAVFALAVLTFLGIPFFSAAPHKGIVA